MTNLSRSVSQDQAVSSLILLVATKIKAAEEIPSNHVLHSIADCKKVDDNIAIPTLWRKETQLVFFFLKCNEKEIK